MTESTKFSQPILWEGENVPVAHVPESNGHEHWELIDKQAQLTGAVEVELPDQADDVVEDGEDDVDWYGDWPHHLLGLCGHLVPILEMDHSNLRDLFYNIISLSLKYLDMIISCTVIQFNNIIVKKIPFVHNPLPHFLPFWVSPAYYDPRLSNEHECR